MKKMIILLFTVLLFFTACANQEDPIVTEHKNDATTVSDITKKDIEVSDDKVARQDLSMSNYECCMTKDGFYYLKTVEPEDSGESYSLIMHLNAPSMLEVPLCNKPDCKHTDDTCNAFVKSAASDCTLFTDQKKLYLLTQQSSSMGGDKVDIMNGDSEQIGDEAVVKKGIGISTSPQIIYSLNFDGTNRTKLIELESNTKLEQPFILGGDKVYCRKYDTKSKKSDDNGGYTYTMTNENEGLVCIDLVTKTISPLGDLKDKNIIGVYKNKLVIESLHSDVDPDTIDMNNDAAFFKYYNNMDHSIMTLDLDTKKEKTYITKKTTMLDSVIYGDNIICYFDESAKKVKKLDLETGKTSDVPVFMKKSRPSIYKIIDGKLLYAFYEDKQVNAEVENYYCYDFATGKNEEIKLSVKSDARAGEKTIYTVDILDEIGDSYLVVSKLDEEKEKTWAGTFQYNTKKRYYALIKKSDYWKSKPNYSYFEED